MILKLKIYRLAEFGRKEISIAESEMPGLMALREEYSGKAPLKRSKNFGMSSHDYPNGSFN